MPGNIKHITKFFSALLVAVILWVAVGPVPAQAESAFFGFSPAQKTVRIGESVKLSLVIDTGSSSVNAAEGSITFDGNLLKAVSVSKGSVFSYWPQEPTISGSAVSFAGGSPKGYSGSGTAVLAVTFKALQEGAAAVSISSGRILLADGSGTNIYAGARSANITIAAASQTETSPLPVQGEFAVRSTTHPDPAQWYSGNAVRFEWTVPPAATQVSFTADRNPDTVPGSSGYGLYRYHTYKNVADGIWYFHIKYYSRAGWSATQHVRFQIDTERPTWQSLTQPDLSQNAFDFEATDTPSGIDHFEVSLDGNPPVSWIKTGSQLYALADVTKGGHVLSVQAVDKAGNKSSKELAFTVREPVQSAPQQQVPVVIAAPAAAGNQTLVIVLSGMCLLLLLLAVLLLWLLVKSRRSCRLGRDIVPYDLYHQISRDFMALKKQLGQDIRILEKKQLNIPLTKEEAKILIQLRKHELLIDSLLLKEFSETTKVDHKRQ